MTDANFKLSLPKPVDVYLAKHAAGLRNAAETGGLILSENACTNVAHDLEVVAAAMAKLVAAGKNVETALSAWRTSGQPDLGKVVEGHNDLVAALAAFGGAA